MSCMATNGIQKMKMACEPIPRQKAEMNDDMMDLEMLESNYAFM